MGRLFAAALLLLQVAASTYGLPYQLRQAREPDTPDTQQHPGAARVDEDGLPYAGESSLSRELADLSALQLQLVELQREIQTRQKWLAEAAGLVTATADSDGPTDCDGGVACLVHTILRKARHTAAAVFDFSHRQDGHDDLLWAANQALAIKIPLPPWRRARNGTGSEAEQLPQETLASDGDDSGGGDVDLIIGVDPAILALPFAVFIFALVLSRLFTFHIGYDVVDSASFPLRASGWHDRCAGQREGQCPRLRHFCDRVMGAGGFVRWWGGERGNGVRLGADAAGAHEYVEEKRADLDEKRALILEEGGDEEVEHRDEAEGEHEREELLTLGEELASFRAALEMVEGIVAAEEGRARGRGG